MSNKEIGLLVGAFAVVALLGAGAFALTTTPAQPTIIQVPQETSAAATSPGQGGGITNATNLARECIIDLYGGVGHIPKMGVGKASVDDTIAQCVQARGGQIVTGGQCDASDTDGCSNTFADTGQDPDSDPVAIIFDVMDASGVVVDELFVTQGAQVLGGGGEGVCYVGSCVAEVGCQNASELCKISLYYTKAECEANGQAWCGSAGGGGPTEPSCQKQVVDECRGGKLVGCEMGQCIAEGVIRCSGKEVKPRDCPAGGGGATGTCIENPYATDPCLISIKCVEPTPEFCGEVGCVPAGTCTQNQCLGSTDCYLFEGGGGGGECPVDDGSACKLIYCYAPQQYNCQNGHGSCVTCPGGGGECNPDLECRSGDGCDPQCDRQSCAGDPDCI